MDASKELLLFSKLAGFTGFEDWLREQDADATKYLKSAGDTMAIHRAQGKALFIEEMTKLLAKGKTLR
jgi:DNA recombination-dependent growth factor C